MAKGVAEITNSDKVVSLKENESTFLPQWETHRLVNLEPESLEFIEVQSGSSLGEDRVMRFEDVCRPNYRLITRSV